MVSPGEWDKQFSLGCFLFRYNNGNNLTASTLNTEVGNQGIGGLVITMADLGLTNGTTIYGYSLMAQDVTATNSAQLLDWTNGTFYPTTTDGATGGGGIDFTIAQFRNHHAKTTGVNPDFRGCTRGYPAGRIPC